MTGLQLLETHCPNLDFQNDNLRFGYHPECYYIPHSASLFCKNKNKIILNNINNIKIILNHINIIRVKS